MCRSMEEKWNRVREEGREEDREEGALKVLFSLVQSGFLSLAQAAQQMGLTENQFSEKLIQANICTAQ